MADDSKTEKASAKKRRDERKKGNVFKSQDIITIVSVIGCFYGLRFFAPLIYETVKSFLIQCINYVHEFSSFSNEQTIYIQNQMIIDVAKGALPLLLVSVAISIITTGVQTKFLFTAENLKFKLSKINPIEGVRKMFAFKNAVELIKNILKVTLLIVILYNFIMDRVIEVPRTMDMALENSLKYVIEEIIALVKLVVMWFGIIAGFDYFYQWWDYERQIKMSKHDVKEEYKQMEGNPEIKGKIKELQRQKARNRMMQAVPTADVIIRNPTHYAVALKYNQDDDNAPMVVAKGQDELALRIVKIGEENHVYILENQPLARAIYASSDVNQEISPEFYGTIAEILVYVYKLNNKVLK